MISAQVQKQYRTAKIIKNTTNTRKQLIFGANVYKK